MGLPTVAVCPVLKRARMAPLALRTIILGFVVGAVARSAVTRLPVFVPVVFANNQFGH
mgnify:CR=1 FL=1